MDISMPRVDGYEATRRIRALGPAYSSLPIVALTAHAAPDPQRFRDAGFNDLLSKPLLRWELVATLQTVSAAAKIDIAPPDAEICEANVVSPTDHRQALARRADDLKEDIGTEAVADVFDAAALDISRHSATFARFGNNEPFEDVELKRALHSISGIARTIGCIMLADDARQLERKDAVLVVGDLGLVRLTRTIEQLRQDLAEISKSLRNVGSTKLLEQVE